MNQIAQPLLIWYQNNKRDLPWRDQNNPYYTWISEIMLQQTRVEVVKDYFTRFIKTLPTLHDLANADQETLMKLWEGLGYYSRARNLQKCAVQCVQQHEGKLPATYEDLLQLPGIGPYTAGAIASIGFHLPYPAVDGNVLRVVSRLSNNNSDITSALYKTAVTKQVQSIIPSAQPGDFNQALMDLGATICIPNGMPRCNICPLAEYCQGHQKGTAYLLPNKPAKKARKIEHRTILIITNGSQFLIEQRPDQGLLAGLYEFVNLPIKQTKKEIVQLPLLQNTEVKKIEKLSPAKHIFSHIEWHMQGYLVEIDANTCNLLPNQIWASKEQIDVQYTMPVALKFYKNFILNKPAVRQAKFDF